MSPDLALLSTLAGLNYPGLKLIFMVPKVFEPLKFDCSLNEYLFLADVNFDVCFMGTIRLTKL